MRLACRTHFPISILILFTSYSLIIGAMQDDHEPARSISSEESRFSEDFRSDAEDDAPLQDDDNPVQ